jgi:hypothetical protein
LKPTALWCASQSWAGRYFVADFDVEMLPGADGKLEKANFKGKSIEGYDNLKQNDWSEEHGGHEIKTIEITYTRSPAPPHR